MFVGVCVCMDLSVCVGEYISMGKTIYFVSSAFSACVFGYMNLKCFDLYVCEYVWEIYNITQYITF